MKKIEGLQLKINTKTFSHESNIMLERELFPTLIL